MRCKIARALLLGALLAAVVVPQMSSPDRRMAFLGILGTPMIDSRQGVVYRKSHVVVVMCAAAATPVVKNSP